MSTLLNSCRAAALALLLLGGSAAAQAATATTTANANVRAGAGTQFRVIATVPAGTRLDIGTCRAGWCDLTIRGQRGFIAQSLLQAAPTGPGQPQRATMPVDNSRPMAPSPSQPEPQRQTPPRR